MTWSCRLIPLVNNTGQLCTRMRASCPSPCISCSVMTVSQFLCWQEGLRSGSARETWRTIWCRRASISQASGFLTLAVELDCWEYWLCIVEHSQFISRITWVKAACTLVFFFFSFLRRRSHFMCMVSQPHLFLSFVRKVCKCQRWRIRAWKMSVVWKLSGIAWFKTHTGTSYPHISPFYLDHGCKK
jgi:hypothetical protein